MILDAFLSHLENPRQTGRGWMSRCPAHDDRSPSLSIKEGDDGRILLKDFAGCSVEKIVESIGLKLADLFEGNQSSEVRNHYREKRRLSHNIQNTKCSLAGAYRQAEKVIESATGVNISGWSKSELDRKMNMVCDAYKLLSGEKHDY